MAFSFLPKSLPSLNTLSHFGEWWRKRWHALFFGIFLLTVLASVFSWYRSLLLFHWNEEQEKAYRQSVNKQTEFRRNTFDEVLKSLDARAAAHRESVQFSRDLFSSKREK